MVKTNKRFVPELDAIKDLAKYRIPYPEHGLARSAGEAANIAEQLGFPVVLKIASPDIPHKSDVGGVITGLNSPENVAQEYDCMIRSVLKKVPQASVLGVLVCHQAPEGLEVIVGSTHDSVFGPTLMFGLGGIYTEIFKDVAFRIVPLELIDAEEMIREIKGFPLLTGVRGQTGRDIQQLTELILSVSRMLAADPSILELDLNPVRLYENGLIALDVRIFRGDA